MPAVQCRCTEDNVIMNMRFIRMRCHNKSMLSFQKTRSSLVPDTVCFLRHYLTGLERLPQLISNDFSVPVPFGQMKICPSHQSKLIRCSMWIALK